MLPFHMNNKPRLKSNKIAGLAEATVEQLDISIAANWFLSQMSAISPCPAATHEGECSNSESADTKPAKARRSKGKRRRISSKRDIRRAEPLSVGLRSRQTAADSTQEAAWLSQCQALYKRLPKQSRYAKHRLKVLSKAMAILRRRRQALTSPFVLLAAEAVTHFTFIGVTCISYALLNEMVCGNPSQHSLKLALHCIVTN